MDTRERNRYQSERQKGNSSQHKETETQVKITKNQKGGIFEHDPEEQEIAFLCKGRVKLSFTKEKDEIVEEGKMMLLPLGEHLILEALEDTYMCICKLNPEVAICESLRIEVLCKSIPRGEKPFKPLVMKEPIIRFLDSLILCIQDKLMCTHFFQMKMSELMFLLRAYYPKEEIATFFFPLLGGDMVFRSYVYKNATAISSVKELAAKANMSERGFLKRFKRVMDCTPADFINAQKTKQIQKELLYTHLPIKEISDKYGFSSVQAFTTFCKNKLKKTPARIRKENCFSE
ncbi:AraC family transcriptional regulator [Bacteroides sp. 51]|uniref:helix-turn-helix domain-containing protein n=1 Tax=Bacteroides sp. 51 TaxID=2302938 RepID=UPI0013D2188B|nr:helix-turn-helix transcriptional regulator [Bacteroides sp. 51]NDV80705.1 AraC family transcriptional regulator [Bacteroides sp. 51]